MKHHNNLIRDKLSEKYNFRIQKFIVDMAEKPFVVEKYKENKLNVFEHNQHYIPYKQIKLNDSTSNSSSKVRFKSQPRNISNYNTTDKEIDIPILPDIVESLHKKYANLQ